MKDIPKIFYDRYLNKKEIMFRLPVSLNIQEVWKEVVQYRRNLGREINLKDHNNKNFWYNVNSKIEEQIDSINNLATTDLFHSLPGDVSVDLMNDVLIDEAFHSSVIEGAFSTRQRSQKIIKNMMSPANKDEQMILNNYKALEYVLENLHRRIDENVIQDIYRIVTSNTLDRSDIVEKYRTDKVFIWDERNQEVIYEAPNHLMLENLMKNLVNFINDENDGIHPIIKAAIIHFNFVYIHPFFDGNGRTARALFFMYLLKNGFSYFKFFSISSIIQEERSKYYKAIKDVEDHDGDLTYFISYIADMIRKAIDMTWVLFKKEFAYKIFKNKLAEKNTYISERIDRALKYYLKSNVTLVTIEEHRKKYNTSYETARMDLNKLSSLGVFERTKQGKLFVYKANNLDVILRNLKEI